MAINPEKIDVTTVDKLDDLNLALGNFFAHTNLNGKLGKADLAALAAFLAPYVTAVGGSGFVATTGNALPPASLGKFTIVGSGTFTQTTGGNVVTTELFNILGSNSTTWSLVKAIPLPASIAQKIELQYKGTFDDVNDAITALPLIERKLGDTVGIKENGQVVEYWFERTLKDDGLVKKSVDILYEIDESTEVVINPTNMVSFGFSANSYINTSNVKVGQSGSTSSLKDLDVGDHFL